MEEMYGEFSFNGRSCTEFGLHYIPSASDRWLSSVPWKAMKETVTGRHGAYYYGQTADVKTFTLECFFEEVTEERLEAIERWLHREREGKLIFGDRPYVYYMVRPSAPSKGQVWAQQSLLMLDMTASGKCTITFEACMPFGILDRNYIEDSQYNVSRGMVQRTGLQMKSRMPADPPHVAGDFLVYNPGTEFANPVLKFYGSAPNGLTLTNTTTNESCSLAAFNLASGTYLQVDPDTGVKLMPNDTYAFEYHLDGYLSLAPCAPYDRGVHVSYTSGSNEVQVLAQNFLDDSFVGKHVFLDGAWRRIIAVRSDHRTAVINANMTKTAVEITDIVVMNQLTLEGDSLALTDLKIEFTPMVR